ncbi:hypothetical protein RYX36_005489 [Vicia faba]
MFLRKFLLAINEIAKKFLERFLLGSFCVSFSRSEGTSELPSRFFPIWTLTFIGEIKRWLIGLIVKIQVRIMMTGDVIKEILMNRSVGVGKRRGLSEDEDEGEDECGGEKEWPEIGEEGNQFWGHEYEGKEG